MVALARPRGEDRSVGARGTEPVRVLADPGRVRAALTPLRRRVLSELHEPDSASGLAPRLGVSRQKLAYHLRVLEELGLLELVEERQRRGCTERLLRTSARTLVVAPELLGEVAADPEERRDRFSSAYLVSTAARLVGDVAALREGARAEGKRLATMTQETEIRFRSPADLRAFTDDLAEAVAGLVARYDEGEAEGARPYRLVLALHPRRDPERVSEGERPSSHGEIP